MLVFEAFCRTVGELCCNVFEKVAVLKLQLWGLVFEWRVDSMGPMVDFSNMFACLVFFIRIGRKNWVVWWGRVVLVAVVVVVAAGGGGGRWWQRWQVVVVAVGDGGGW